ncbi:hypothetical protein V8F20_010632 [Naviculisporaceae sp. PSN 640]
MDGLSAAASIIAVLQLTDSVVRYINAATGATQDRKRIRDGLRSCEFVLRQLCDRADDSEEGKAWAQTMKALEAPGAPLGRIWLALRAVEILMAPKDGAKKVVAYIKWPFTSKEVDKILVTLDREKALLELAVSNNSGLLLQALTRSSKENGFRLVELVDTVGKHASLQENSFKLISQLLNEVLHAKGAVESLEDRSKRQEELAERDAAFRWLSPLDFLQIQNDLFYEEREPGTSSWIIRHKTFRDWFNCTRSAGCKHTELRLYGDPGSGNSIMVNHVQRTLTSGCALVYIYGRYQERGNQSPENIVGAVLKQLGSQCDRVASGIVLAYQRRKHGSPRAIKDLICTALNGPQGPPSLSVLYLFIDGLDEMSADTVKCLDTFQKTLLNSTQHMILHLVLSGRPYAIQSFPSPGYKCQWRGDITVQTSAEDIKVVVKGRFLRNDNMRIVTDGDLAWQGRIISGITHRVMAQSSPFAVARLYVDSVTEEVTKADVINAVAGLSRSFPEHLDRNLQRIRQAPPPRAKLAFQALAWLLNVSTALSQDQLCEALSINTGDKRLVKNRKPSFKIVIESCQGLVQLNEASGTVGFFHHTVMEHLAKQPELRDLAASVRGNCIQYMLYQDFTSTCEDAAEIHRRRERYPLAVHLSVHWAEYVRGDAEEELGQQIIELLTSPAMLSCLQLLPPDFAVESRLLGSFSVPRPETWWDCDKVALPLAACFGLTGIVRKLIAMNHDVNSVIPQDQYYGPLHIAVYRRDLDMTEDLIRPGTNLNLQDRWGLTPLHLAMTLVDASTRTAFVQRLCLHGASTAVRDQDGDTPLHGAIAHADIDVVKVLVDNAAPVNATNHRGETALHYAIRRAIFHDDRSDSRIKPTSLADSSTMACINYLLSVGADASIPDKTGQSPIDAALSSRLMNVILCLLDFSKMPECAWVISADAIEAGKSVCHAIDLKEQFRDLARGASLLEMGQDEAAFNVQKGDSRRLLRLLEGRDFNYNMARATQRLHEAIWARRVDIVVLLLGFGASISEKNKKGRDAKELAQFLGDDEMLEVLSGGWKTRSFRGKTGLEWQSHFQQARPSRSLRDRYSVYQ